jgi:hypothetical protein
MSDLSLLTHDYFENLIDRSFLMNADEQTVALRVTEVRMLPPPKRRTLTGSLVEATVSRLPFSVFFRSEGELGLRQGTYSLDPPDGGEAMIIFLVPLGFENDGVIYEAVFN